MGAFRAPAKLADLFGKVILVIQEGMPIGIRGVALFIRLEVSAQSSYRDLVDMLLIS